MDVYALLAGFLLLLVGAYIRDRLILRRLRAEIAAEVERRVAMDRDHEKAVEIQVRWAPPPPLDPNVFNRILSSTLRGASRLPPRDPEA